MRSTRIPDIGRVPVLGITKLMTAQQNSRNYPLNGISVEEPRAHALKATYYTIAQGARVLNHRGTCQVESADRQELITFGNVRFYFDILIEICT